MRTRAPLLVVLCAVAQGAAGSPPIDGTELVSDTCETACPGARAFAVAAMVASTEITEAVTAKVVAGEIGSTDEAAQMAMFNEMMGQMLPDMCPHQHGLECMVEHSDCTAKPEALALVEPMRGACGRDFEEIDGTELVSDTCETACPGARAFAVAAMVASTEITEAVTAKVVAGEIGSTDEAAQMAMFNEMMGQMLPDMCPHQHGLECMVEHSDCTAKPEALALVEPMRGVCGQEIDGTELVSDTCETACPGARAFAVAAMVASTEITEAVMAKIVAGEIGSTDEAAQMAMFNEMMGQMLPDMCPHQHGLECMVEHSDCTAKPEALALVEPMRGVCPSGKGCISVPNSVIRNFRAKGWEPKVCTTDP